MNVAWPAREFDFDSAAVARFADLLRNGFENPESISGAVKVDIPGHPDLGFVARFGEELAIERGCPETDADTPVSIPVATVHRIFRESEFIDWRDPDIIGTIPFSGDLGLANHLAKSCLRPGDQHRNRKYRNLTEIERLRQPSQIRILELMEEGRPRSGP